VWLTMGLMAAVVLVIFVADNPSLYPGQRHQVMVLDRAAALDDVLPATPRSAR